MQKTGTPIYLPISKKAIGWLPEKGNMSDECLIFPKLPREICTKRYITPWMEAFVNARKWVEEKVK
jgi:hypothetical protein